MARRNRVTPFGEIVAIPERGTMLGNRGILHDDRGDVVRTSQVRRWLCCVLEWKERRRVIMKPRSYTELFFLDEATALAAGHRPCFECRRRAALAYREAWARAFGVLPRADDMDRVLAAERRTRGGEKKTHTASLDDLPDGAFFVRDGSPWLLHAGRRWPWTAAGYGPPLEAGTGPVEVLTPASTVGVLRAGYVPQIAWAGKR